MVDGKKVTEHDLKHGQEIQIGGTTAEAAHDRHRRCRDTLVAAQKPARELKPDEGV